MFGSRVICIQGRIHCFAQSSHFVRSRVLSIEKLHLSKIKQCSNVTSKNQRLASNVVKVENVHLEELEQLKTKNLDEYLYEGNTRKKYESENEATNDPDLTENEILNEDVSKLYPSSRYAVSNIYYILKQELGDQSLLSIQYKSYNINKKLFWECVYVVSWPTKKSFTAKGESKKSASGEAALKCLLWLREQGRVKGNKPIIYANEEVLDELHKPISIHLDSNILKEDVKNIIESPKSSNDLFTLRESNIFDKMSKPFSYCHKRNKILQERLSKEGNATDCNMLISQPRKISAISLARFIASERGETVGDVVGYSVRVESKYPQFPAGMLFCTTGILCIILKQNPNLRGFSHVILDEVHERTTEIDILFVLLKRALLNNPSLKLIIMSATINTELYLKYFNCDKIDVPGKMFPVKMHFLEDFEDILYISEKQKDKNTDILTVNLQQIVSLIKWILNKKSPGTILCFLPGWAEIKNINTLLTRDSSIEQKLLILHVHSKLSLFDQDRIFDPVPRNTRKIILATDIAETGLTIPDVVYVIDTTIKNNPTWDNNKYSIQFRRISQANIQQRKGRAGRVQCGESYHFITKKEYDNLRSNPIPGILSSPLESIITMIKCYTDEKCIEFCENMIEPPSRAVMHNALVTLMQLDIIDEHENLTPLGKRLAHITVHPSLGKALILSTIFKCSKPILPIATLDSMNQQIFVNIDNKSTIREVKELYHQTSDHLAIAKLYEEWKKISNESYYKQELFCNEKNISPFKIQLLRKICDVISNNLQTYGIQNNDNSYDSEILPSKDTYSDELICGIMLSSMNKSNQRVKIMASSVNYKKTSWASSYLTYLYGMNYKDIPYMVVYDCSIISPLTILLFGPGFICDESNNDSDNQKTIIVSFGGRNTLKFSCTSEELEMLRSFREVIWSVVNYFLTIDDRSPNLVNELNFMNKYRSELLRVLTKMLDTNAKKIQ
ncbi:hypothetical protein M0802_003352 [Mischocyttarus mexicanus]|nr:hypothetical protein M0802_003352 [Mischocyttarus mexicanus]